MPLSEEDIRKIVAATKRDVPTIPEYSIDPKEHYDQHQRLDRMLAAFETAESKIWTAILGGILFVALVTAGIFVKVKGWIG